MSEPYTGSYESDSRTLFFDKSVEPTLIERSINYDKDGNEVTIKIVDDGRMVDDVMDGLGIADLSDHYLYSQYNVDSNVPENLQEV